MKIENISLRRLQIPLRIKFSQSNNSTQVSDSTILEIETSRGTIGFGECCPRPYVTGETFESVKKDMEKIGWFLKKIEINDLNCIQKLVCEVLPSKVGLSTICAVELAILDAFSKENRVFLKDLLGIRHSKTIKYTAVIPIENKLKLPHLLQRFSIFKFKEAKLKVGTDIEDSLEKIELIRRNFKHVKTVRVDANCSWTYEDAVRQIPIYLKNDVRIFEQIFPRGTELEMGRITRQFGSEAKIMADESLTSLEEAKDLINKKLCNRLNFKLSKNGGIFNTLKIYNLARQNGIECQLGAHFGETSILTAAGIWFSLLAKNLKSAEGAMGTYLLETDIADPSICFNQNAEISNPLEQLPGFGLGLNIETETRISL